MSQKKNKQKNKSEVSAVGIGLKAIWISISTVLKLVFAVVLIICCIGGGLLLGVFAGCIITTEPVTEEQLDLSYKGAPTQILDKDGNVLATIQGSDTINRELVEFDQVPTDLFNAFIAVEDERFYSHPGVDIKRSVAAALGFVIPSLDSHGGSTITQQVIKNITGDDSMSVPRKIREQWRALQLEKDLSKEDILELYVNVIYMGSNLYGVQTASQAYFNKDVSDLSLAECAFLAGITNNPSKYNPLTTIGRANCYKRQIHILDMMLKCGFITDEQYIQAIQDDLIINDDYRQEAKKAAIYSYFVDAVLTDAKEALIEAGYSKTEASDIIYNQGVTIYSTQDSRIQQIFDEEFCNLDNFPVNHLYTSTADMAQAASVLIDPTNGHILAMYGGYGEKTTSLSFNFATRAKRQPGSAIKPILVYAPLIDAGIISPSTITDDIPVYYNYQTPELVWPKNSYSQHRGLVTTQWAIQQSSNVVAVSLFKDNMSRCLNHLKTLGIDRTDEMYLSTALGGLNQGVTPLEMTAAYVPFANGGTYYTPITFTKICDTNGGLILSNEPKASTVYEKAGTTTLMTEMLQSVVTNGTGTAAAIKNGAGQKIAVAGKTGTTTSSVDYWFAGYTPYYTCSVWYGYEFNKPISTAEKGAAAKLWAAIMSRVHENLSPRPFTTSSEGLVSCTICKYSGMLPSAICNSDPRGDAIITATFISGTEPTQTCQVHQTVTICTRARDDAGKYYRASEYCKDYTKKEITGTYREISDLSYQYMILEDAFPRDWDYELTHSLEVCPFCTAVFGGITPPAGGEGTGDEGVGGDENPGETSGNTAEIIINTFNPQYSYNWYKLSKNGVIIK